MVSTFLNKSVIIRRRAIYPDSVGLCGAVFPAYAQMIDAGFVGHDLFVSAIVIPDGEPKNYKFFAVPSGRGFTYTFDLDFISTAYPVDGENIVCHVFLKKTSN